MQLAKSQIQHGMKVSKVHNNLVLQAPEGAVVPTRTQLKNIATFMKRSKLPTTDTLANLLGLYTVHYRFLRDLAVFRVEYLFVSEWQKPHQLSVLPPEMLPPSASPTSPPQSQTPLVSSTAPAPPWSPLITRVRVKLR